jgi:hypothetical protein
MVSPSSGPTATMANTKVRIYEWGQIPPFSLVSRPHNTAGFTYIIIGLACYQSHSLCISCPDLRLLHHCPHRHGLYFADTVSPSPRSACPPQCYDFTCTGCFWNLCMDLFQATADWRTVFSTLGGQFRIMLTLSSPGCPSGGYYSQLRCQHCARDVSRTGPCGKILSPSIQTRLTTLLPKYILTLLQGLYSSIHPCLRSSGSRTHRH